MSISILKGSFEIFSLLLLLNPNTYTTTKKIRNAFSHTKQSTIYMRLRKLELQGLIHKHIKKVDRAGIDRTEYILCPKGKDLVQTLLDLILEKLQPFIHKIIQQINKVEDPIKKEKESLIDTFLMEFTEDSSSLVDNETLQEQIKIVKKLLQHYL